MDLREGGRWRSRPVPAFVVRLAVVAVPLAVGFGVAVLFASAVARPRHGAALVGWWLASLAASSVAFAVVWREAQRFLPLATLLKWSLVFPDRTPSRFRVALRAGSTRNLERRVAELHTSHADVDTERTLENVLSLAAALNAHDRLTRGHCERVRAVSELIAEQLKVAPMDRDRLRWASLLHDCGKLAVDPGILTKPGALNDDEWLAMRRHPEEGAHFAEPLREWLGDWAHSIEQHHEKWDGSGYPKGLAGKDIALGARIVAVADAYDVMTSHRSYRRPQSPASAKAELARCGGDHFDPDIVRAFLRVSTGYLAWLLFPVAWLAQLGLTVSGASGAAARAIRTSTQSAAAVGAGTVAVVAGVAMGLAPVSKPASHSGATHVATAPPPAAVPAASAPQPPAPIANEAVPPAARGASATGTASGGIPGPALAAPVAAPSAPAPTSPPAPPPKPSSTQHVIRLAACVDPVRVVIEAIPGVSITPTRAC
jgi:putative nucleotidyltransferase with HDIG domain